MKSKVLKKIFVVFTFVITFLQNVVGVSAANFVPEPINVVYEHEYTNLGTDASSVNVRKVKYTDKSGKVKYGYAYCLEGGAGTVSVNDEYVLDETGEYANKVTGELEDAGLRYITTNGFWGNGNVTSGPTTDAENVEFAITQLAIWLYYYDISKDETKYDMEISYRRISTLAREVRANKYDSSNSTFVKIVKEANELCEGAKKARLEQVDCQKDNTKCPVDIKDSLSVNVNNNVLKLTEDGKYLESDLINISLVNISSAKVSISDNKFSVVSEDGKVVSTVKNGDKVKVRANSDKVTDNINVKVSFTSTSSNRLPYQYYGGTYTYNGTTLAKQRLLFSAGFNTITIKETLEFNYELNKQDIEFSKIDVTTGKELPGATLEVRDSNGKLIESWVSTEETHYIKLAPGKYTLTETIAPAGYDLSTKTVEFEVKTDGSVTKVVMENKPSYVNVEFSKIDVTTGKELPGATLEVRDVNGKLIESWVSTETTHYIKLAPGKYTLTEIVAPEGYILSNETKEFEVKTDGSVTKVVMENKPSRVNVEFSKIDILTGKELPGAHLEIRDNEGNFVKSWISSDTPYYIELAPGKYTLTETLAPEGYELSTEIIEFEVKLDGSVTKVVMENKPYIEVPITSLNASSTTMIIGSLLIGLGLVVVYSYVKKYEA